MTNKLYGAIAQLGARLTGSQEVRGSNPLAPPIKSTPLWCAFLYPSFNQIGF